MTADRDLTRVVRSWLKENEHESADRVLDTVLARLDTTPQRRSWWPARRSPMSTYARLIVAAAALVVVAVVGYTVMPRSGIGRATPTPTASPSPAVAQLPSNDTVALAAGSYVTGDPFPLRVTATVPAGWHGQIYGQYYADLWAEGTDEDGLLFQLPDRVAVDPCDYGKHLVDIPGSTVDDLVGALRHMPGIVVSNVASTSIDGYTGTTLVVTAPKDISSCNVSPDGYAIWQNPLGGHSPTFSGGQSIQIWILDVAGQRLTIALQDSNYTTAQRAAAQAVFQSIRLAPVN